MEALVFFNMRFFFSVTLIYDMLTKNYPSEDSKTVVDYLGILVTLLHYEKTMKRGHDQGYSYKRKKHNLKLAFSLNGNP